MALGNKKCFSKYTWLEREREREREGERGVCWEDIAGRERHNTRREEWTFHRIFNSCFSYFRKSNVW